MDEDNRGDFQFSPPAQENPEQTADRLLAEDWMQPQTRDFWTKFDSFDWEKIRNGLPQDESILHDFEQHIKTIRLYADKLTSDEDKKYEIKHNGGDESRIRRQISSDNQCLFTQLKEIFEYYSGEKDLLSELRSEDFSWENKEERVQKKTEYDRSRKEMCIVRLMPSDKPMYAKIEIEVVPGQKWGDLPDSRSSFFKRTNERSPIQRTITPAVLEIHVSRLNKNFFVGSLLNLKPGFLSKQGLLDTDYTEEEKKQIEYYRAQSEKNAEEFSKTQEKRGTPKVTPEPLPAPAPEVKIIPPANNVLPEPPKPVNVVNSQNTTYGEYETSPEEKKLAEEEVDKLKKELELRKGEKKIIEEEIEKLKKPKGLLIFLGIGASRNESERRRKEQELFDKAREIEKLKGKIAGIVRDYHL